MRSEIGGEAWGFIEHRPPSMRAHAPHTLRGGRLDGWMAGARACALARRMDGSGKAHPPSIHPRASDQGRPSRTRIHPPSRPPTRLHPRPSLLPHSIQPCTHSSSPLAAPFLPVRNPSSLHLTCEEGLRGQVSVAAIERPCQSKVTCFELGRNNGEIVLLV